MNLPRVGIGLPNLGPYASPEAIHQIATAADTAGMHAVSVTDRLLLPAHEGWHNAAQLPETPVYDAIETLTWVAGQTQRVRLATAIIASLFQPPIVLARRLATLDRLSGGRVDVGLGQGWMPEEFAAVDVAMSRRGQGFAEHLAVMRACWGPDPVAYDGEHYCLAPSKVGPKPTQQRIPVLIGAVSRRAVQRAAEVGDGFITAVKDWETSRADIQRYRDVGGTGEVAVRVFAPPWLDFDHLDAPLTGIGGAVRDELEQWATAGATEVHWDLSGVGVPPHRQVEAIGAIARVRGPAWT